MEDELLLGLQNFDPDALGQIFDDFAPGIFKYLTRLGLGPVEADQTTGDVFGNMLDRVAKGGGPQKNLRSYLFETAYHLVIDGAREVQNHILPEGAAEALVHIDPMTVQTEVEGNLFNDSLAELMMTELTEDQRNVIVLRFQEEFSLKETAEIMNKNVNSIKALQNRATNNLREILGNDLE